MNSDYRASYKWQHRGEAPPKKHKTKIKKVKPEPEYTIVTESIDGFLLEVLLASGELKEYFTKEQRYPGMVFLGTGVQMEEIIIPPKPYYKATKTVINRYHLQSIYPFEGLC